MLLTKNMFKSLFYSILNLIQAVINDMTILRNSIFSEIKFIFPIYNCIFLAKTKRSVKLFIPIFTEINVPMKIIIINGPNLNLLGKREPEIYGNMTFDIFYEQLKTKYPSITLSYFQSNIEGELIDKIQEVGFTYDGIILNAAAYTHTSIGIGDAVKAISTPVIEVHISNTFSRETFRHQSFISPNAKGIIIGFGLKSYELALQSFL
jgi:3-dehydroquinate dehydratase-2